MKPTPIFCRLLPVLVALVLGGCGLSQPYPAKQYFALSTGEPDSGTRQRAGQVLRVEPVRVARPFASAEFKYLVGPDKFERDYYVNFIASPGDLVTALVIEWMAETGSFEAVVGGASTLGSDLVLRCQVTRLYGDFSGASSPAAVVSMRAFLIDNSTVEGRVLLTKEYRQDISIGGSTPDALVGGWGEALREILARLSSDISDEMRASSP